MVLERIANPSSGESRFLSSSLSHSAKLYKKENMLKPNKTFKLSKTTKRMLCSITNTEQRNQYKRMMIDAELCAAIVPKSIKSDRGAPRGNGPTGYQTNDTGTASTSTT
jgi:hypothetical protein